MCFEIKSVPSGSHTAQILFVTVIKDWIVFRNDSFWNELRLTSISQWVGKDCPFTSVCRFTCRCDIELHHDVLIRFTEKEAHVYISPWLHFSKTSAPSLWHWTSARRADSVYGYQIACLGESRNCSKRVSLPLNLSTVCWFGSIGLLPARTNPTLM